MLPPKSRNGQKTVFEVWKTISREFRCEPRRFTLWMRPMLNRTVTFKRSVMSSWENFHDDPALQSNEDGVGNSGPLLRMDRTHRSLTILGHAKYRILRPVECMDAYAERSVTDRGEWWHWLGIEYCSLFWDISAQSHDLTGEWGGVRGSHRNSREIVFSYFKNRFLKSKIFRKKKKKKSRNFFFLCKI